MAGPALKRRVLLGRIAGAHGVRGEVLIQTYTATPHAIAAYGALADSSGARTFTILTMRATASGVVARVQGIDDRTAAAALRGVELYVDRDSLPPAAAEEYYHDDLIGLSAVDGGGCAVGRIVAVHNFGAGDLLEIALAASGSTELVPFTQTHVPEIDLAGGRAVVLFPSPDADPE